MAPRKDLGRRHIVWLSALKFVEASRSPGLGDSGPALQREDGKPPDIPLFILLPVPY